MIMDSNVVKKQSPTRPIDKVGDLAQKQCKTFSLKKYKRLIIP